MTQSHLVFWKIHPYIPAQPLPVGLPLRATEDEVRARIEGTSSPGHGVPLLAALLFTEDGTLVVNTAPAWPSPGPAFERPGRRATLTQPQLAACFNLAAAHGHLWAEGWAQGIATLGGPMSPRAGAEDWTPAQRDGWRQALAWVGTTGLVPLAALAEICPDSPPPGGIVCPQVDDDGDAVHTTATGRVEWLCRRDGTVVLSVCRPEVGPVLRATVSPRSSRVDAWEVPGKPYALRHVDALVSTATALDVPRAELQALRERLEARCGEEVRTRQEEGWVDMKQFVTERFPGLMGGADSAWSIPLALGRHLEARGIPASFMERRTLLRLALAGGGGEEDALEAVREVFAEGLKP